MPSVSHVSRALLAVVTFCLAVAVVGACSGSGGGNGDTSARDASPGDVVAPRRDSSAASADSTPAPSAEASTDATPEDVAASDAGPSDGGGVDGDAGVADATLGDAPSEASGDAGLMTDVSDAAPTFAVPFQYTPGWAGVTAVSVVGGFGQPSDWKPLEPFVDLVADGHGGFSGSAQLPAGTYPYLFLVTGDEAASSPATYARYVVDPANSSYEACPAGSPTFTDAAPQPCSTVTAPQSTPAALLRVSGTVTSSGAPEPGYLVILERDETGSHHYMANRTNTAPKPDAGTGDGGVTTEGTYAFLVAPGKYRLQVWHPTLLSETDEQRSPTTLQALREAVSSPVEVQAAVAFPNVDVAYTAAEYDALSPRNDGDGGAALPTSFTFTVANGSHGAEVAVYGPGSSVEDPWWQSAMERDGGTVVFDGGFNLSTGAGTSVQPGTQYWWGVWQYPPASDAGVSWSNQSMVFPITWQ